MVQSDGFAVYDKFDTLPGKLHLCCWAHVRRNFVEAEGNDPPRARHAIGQIGGLYAVEEKLRMEHLEDVYKRQDNELYSSEEHYNSLKEKFPVPKASDIMISAVGTIGKCYIVKELSLIHIRCV